MLFSYFFFSSAAADSDDEEEDMYQRVKVKFKFEATNEVELEVCCQKYFFKNRKKKRIIIEDFLTFFSFHFICKAEEGTELKVIEKFDSTGSTEWWLCERKDGARGLY